MSDARGRRGQAEGIGVLLLTAVVILGVGTFGAFYLQSVGDQAASERVPADLRVVAIHDSVADETTITVTHRGGEPIEDGVIHLKGRGATYALLPDPFESGNTNTTTVAGAPTRSQLRVVIVENATGAVAFQSTVTVQESGDGGGPASRFDPLSVSLDQPTSSGTHTAGTTDTFE